jgi:hypothetical protein
VRTDEAVLRFSDAWQRHGTHGGRHDGLRCRLKTKCTVLANARGRRRSEADKYRVDDIHLPIKNSATLSTEAGLASRKLRCIMIEFARCFVKPMVESTADAMSEREVH